MVVNRLVAGSRKRHRRIPALALVLVALAVHLPISCWLSWTAVAPEGGRLIFGLLLHQLLLGIFSFAPALLVILIWPRRLPTTITVIGGGLLLLLWTYADTGFMEIYGYRLDGRTWRLLTTPGAGDILDLGAGTRKTIRLEVALIFGLGVLFGGGLVVAAYRLRRRWVDRVGTVPVVVTASLLPVLVVAGLVVEAFGIRRGELPAAEVSRRFGPLHPRLAPARLPAVIPPGLAPERLAEATLKTPPPPAGKAATRPHIIMLHLEGARFDIDDPAVIPHLAALGDAGFRATRHFSTGTTTRYAVFGMFYGLSGAWWESAERDRAGSPLVACLEQQGYRTHVYSATKVTNPPFHLTCFRGVDQLVDTWDDAELGGRMWRDRAMTDRIVADIDAAAEPLFVFAIYDASHYPYLYPPEHAVFAPATSLEKLDLVTARREQDRAAFAALKNRYRNSLHYVDSQVARILEALDRAGRTEDSIVLVFGDHGEEFGEIGFGPGQVLHNGAINHGQTHTLLVGRLPGVKGRRVEHLTSHGDFPATIFTRLGLGDGAFGHGRDLLDPGSRLPTVATYDEVAFLGPKKWTRLGRLPWNRDRLETIDPDGTALDTPVDPTQLRTSLNWLLRYAVEE